MTTCDGDMCAIGILIVRFDLADYHGVANFMSYVLEDIRKLDEAEGDCALHELVIWYFCNLSNPLAEADKFIRVGGVPNVRKIGVLTQLAVL